MGTDVYLVWKAMSKKDEDKQITGFSIKDGNNGYLRASIGMVKENQVLREVFPDCWEGGKRVKFTQEFWEGVQVIGAKYIASVLFDFPLHIENSEAEKYAQLGESISGLFTKMGFKEEGMTRKLRLPSAVMWLNSLFQFVALGMEKEEASLQPKVEISW